LINTTGNFGIGTTTPDHLFEVQGNYAANALVSFDETGNQDIFTASASGATKFTIGNLGDVTIGASTADDVDITLYGDIFQQGGSNISDFSSIANINDVFVYDTTKDSDSGAWTNDDTSQQLSWYTETKDDGPGDACVVGTDDRCGRSSSP